MDYINRILKESIRDILLENRESKNINLARKYLKGNGYGDEDAQKVLDAIRTDIPNSRLAQCKFLLGVSRLYIERQLNDGSSIHTINKLLPYIASETHLNEYDNNLNGMSLDDINNRFSSVIQQDSEVSRKNSYSKQHIKNNDYNIVRIPDFETASKYGKYTSWCVTHGERMYNNYTHNGLGLFYFCLKNGFENIEKKQGENAPLDEYGLSMIAVSVDEEGEVNTITSRWNHDMKGNDHIMSKDELEYLLGVNFYETFKPYNEEELMKKGYATIKKLREMLADGQDLSNILKSSQSISNNLLLFSNKNNKYILYNTKSRSIPDWITNWIDNIKSFHYKLFEIELNNKWSFIDTDGNLIGNGKYWFDWIGDFYNGFALVKLGNKVSFIDTNKKLIGDGKLWVDDAYDFINGFAAIKLNDKWSFIDTDGKLIGNGKLWFDNVRNFQNGLALVKLNDEWFFIDKNLNFYDVETRRQIESPLNNEGVDRIGRILRECIDNYLNRKY